VLESRDARVCWHSTYPQHPRGFERFGRQPTGLFSRKPDHEQITHSFIRRDRQHHNRPSDLNTLFRSHKRSLKSRDETGQEEFSHEPEEEVTDPREETRLRPLIAGESWH
jgi:hypothetical protein